jgi:hypothetical protein
MDFNFQIQVVKINVEIWCDLCFLQSLLATLCLFPTKFQTMDKTQIFTDVQMKMYNWCNKWVQAIPGFWLHRCCSFHLFLATPTFLLPFGLYSHTNLGKPVLIILDSHPQSRSTWHYDVKFLAFATHNFILYLYLSSQDTFTYHNSVHFIEFAIHFSSHVYEFKKSTEASNWLKSLTSNFQCNFM